ncbi:hypothetical protein FSARC_11371 [Fusarium sarcochroum]|uniref:Calpain catalytic domain-containing protein n=1 Tax=Fusarium sarcochroum TaxID=1208366 RepID=A0A8H4TGE2_9HYPO|nr:hypothetical protein FSARC_11371 [Fusarium sarcochroum]
MPPNKLSEVLDDPDGSCGPDFTQDNTISAMEKQKRTKKKSKQKLLPQDSINQTWNKFSEPVFQKALTVLPSDTVVSTKSAASSNELLSVGYNRAAKECRQLVEKIIQQCTRFNLRYRDEWDLDWDLKWGKGHCLNGLGEQTFDLDQQTSAECKDEVPRAAKRVYEIFQRPTFMNNISGGDVKQGNLGDCWFVAALTALANVKGGIEKLCVAYNAKIGIYGFVFYRDGEWIYTIIDDKLYLKAPWWDTPSMQRDLIQRQDSDARAAEDNYRKLYQTGSRALFFARCQDQNETWVPLVEKAYAKAHGDYASLDSGWMGEGLEDLSGGVTTQLLVSDILDIQEFWDDRLSKVNKDFLFGVCAGVLEDGYGERNGISEGHAYVIMQAHTLESGQRLLKLRNPWGSHEGIWKGAWSDGSREWTKEAQDELEHQFGEDSIFWISYEDLLDKITCFDQTRLFWDPEWRCCQRWVSICVPWKSSYKKTFHIRLVTEASPLVLVLSQLDKRYFSGLHGEYSFRLHFRIHDENDGGNDYVLAHGNYLMSRSISLELPGLPPGGYAISLKATADRDPDAKPVEEIIKSECENRMSNEKLAQVGHAYDVAHSKVVNHISDTPMWQKCKNEPSYDSVDKSTDCTLEQEDKRSNPKCSNPLQDDPDEEDEEEKSRPWNAICIVGIRVYHKDEQLELQTIVGKERASP